jgi:hypothetical protein
VLGDDRFVHFWQITAQTISDRAHDAGAALQNLLGLGIARDRIEALVEDCILPGRNQRLSGSDERTQIVMHPTQQPDVLVARILDRTARQHGLDADADVVDVANVGFRDRLDPEAAMCAGDEDAFPLQLAQRLTDRHVAHAVARGQRLDREVHAGAEFTRDQIADDGPLDAEIGRFVERRLLDFAFALVNLAGLSFLGLGVEPGTPDWGRMLFENRTILFTNPVALLLPAAMVILTDVRLGWSNSDDRSPRRWVRFMSNS